jgi:hypothetical protein
MRIREIDELSVGDVVNIDARYAANEYVGEIQGTVTDITPDEVLVQTGSLGLVRLKKNKIDLGKLEVYKYIRSEFDHAFLAGAIILEGFERRLMDAMSREAI